MMNKQYDSIRKAHNRYKRLLIAVIGSISLLMGARSSGIPIPPHFHVDDIDQMKDMPFIHACATGNVSMAKNLIAAGADREQVSRRTGATPLIAAARAGHTRIVKLLLDAGVFLNIRLFRDETALYCAAAHGHRSIVKKLLKAGADITLKTSYDDHALIAAARHNDSGLIRILCAYYPKGIEIPGGMGRTPLMEAASWGNEAAVKELIKAKALINYQNNRGETALFCACNAHTQNNTSVLEELLRYPSLDITLTDKGGKTALMAATETGKIDIVKQLLAYGASRYAYYSWGNDVILAIADNTLEDNRVALRQMLLNTPENKGVLTRTALVTPLMEAVQTGNIDTVNALLADPLLNLNEVNHNDDTALIHAVYCGNESIVRILLAHPAIEVNAINAQHNSALILAIIGRQPVLVALLLQHPDIDINGLHYSDLRGNKRKYEA